MSSESDKPFVCTFEGCGQKFSNNDHLSVHRQKHEFSLKFGSSKSGETLLVDQTPTPTRFLRNCEESGLFQELAQNPFDEDFNKVKEGSEKSTDGSFQQNKVRVTEQVAAASSANIPVAPPPSLANPDKPIPMATPPAHISTTSALTKQKLLQNIQMKEQQKFLEAQLVSMATQQLAQSAQTPDIVQALKAVQEANSTVAMDGKQTSLASVFAAPTGIPDHIANSLSTGRKRRGRKPDDEDPEAKRQKFLERNRAAASRCRAKKKLWVESMEKKSKEMEGVNQALQQEVLSLRTEVQQLKSILIAHKDCPLIVHHAVAGTSSRRDKENAGEGGSMTTEVTLLSQLAAMPSMSPLISSPVPSVGSVVPNITSSHSFATPISQPTATHAAIIFTSNGATHATPEVAKDVEIAAESLAEQ